MSPSELQSRLLRAWQPQTTCAHAQRREGQPRNTTQHPRSRELCWTLTHSCLSPPAQPYKCEWEECGELFGRRSMLLAHVRAMHDGTVRMRVVHSPGGTHQVAEVLGWNGYNSRVAVTPRRGRGRAAEDEAMQRGAEEAKSGWVGSEEKVQLDGAWPTAMSDALFHWPADDVQQAEHKEAYDAPPHFSTLPSLLSPHASSFLAATSPHFLSPEWPLAADSGSGSGLLDGSLYEPPSLWSSPTPAALWQPARFDASSLRATSAIASPLIASPLLSPRLWHSTAEGSSRS